MERRRGGGGARRADKQAKHGRSERQQRQQRLQRLQRQLGGGKQRKAGSRHAASDGDKVRQRRGKVREQL
jgi:hypothetical protein